MLKRGYLFINAETHGEVKGPSTYKLAPDAIEVLEVRHEVSREYTALHGTVSGDRQHAPFIIVKAIDMASPILNEMCCNAERITDMTLHYFIQDGSAPDPVPLYDWKLTDAYVLSVKPIPGRILGGDFADMEDLMEEVSFVYQRIEWHHYPHRAPDGIKQLPDIIQEDSWSGIAG
jgi:type VI secretion system secreted protein Hcp